METAGDRLGNDFPGGFGCVVLGKIDGRQTERLRQHPEQGLLFEGATVDEDFTDAPAGAFLFGDGESELLFCDQTATGELFTEPWRDREAVADEIAGRELGTGLGSRGTVPGEETFDRFVDFGLVGNHPARFVTGLGANRVGGGKVGIGGRNDRQVSIAVFDRDHVVRAAEVERQQVGHGRGQGDHALADAMHVVADEHLLSGDRHHEVVPLRRAWSRSSSSAAPTRSGSGSSDLLRLRLRSLTIIATIPPRNRKNGTIRKTLNMSAKRISAPITKKSAPMAPPPFTKRLGRPRRPCARPLVGRERW